MKIYEKCLNVYEAQWALYMPFRVPLLKIRPLMNMWVSLKISSISRFMINISFVILIIRNYFQLDISRVSPAPESPVSRLGCSAWPGHTALQSHCSHHSEQAPRGHEYIFLTKRSIASVSCLLLRIAITVDNLRPFLALTGDVSDLDVAVKFYRHSEINHDAQS